MVSKVEEARIRREEKKTIDDRPLPQSAHGKMKSLLVEDKINIEPSYNYKSDTNRKVESDDEEEEE